MRRVLYILLAAVVLPLSAVAQVSKQVEVSKDYTPSVSTAQKMAIVPDGREARTNWFVKERLKGATLIEAQLTTGRTHQIRVHMASIGHPVLGDPVYGPKKSPYPVEGGQLLHAFRIGFVHPRTGEEMIFEAGPEPRFTQWLEKLRI